MFGITDILLHFCKKICFSTNRTILPVFGKIFEKEGYMYDIILSFLTAFSLTYFAIPSIINIAKVKHLCDEPGERRAHTESTPSLGGVGIFAGIIFSIVLWTPFKHFGDLQYILCAFIILFLIGAKDDILPIDPTKKLLGQIFAAAILVFKSDIRLTSLYGILGINDLNYWVSVVFSIFTIIVIINAFNLIDGVNGLAGSIGLLITVLFGTWFYQINSMGLSLVAFSLAGAIMAFLKYNFTPAKIFMGDTGALLIGIVAAILAIKFIELHKTSYQQLGFWAFRSVPSLTIAILIIPLYDTLRVFSTRILKGRSPFSADRNHIHHLLLDRGFNHMQTTATLVVVNILFVGFALLLQPFGNMISICILLGTAILLSTILKNLPKHIPSEKDVFKSKNLSNSAGI